MAQGWNTVVVKIRVEKLIGENGQWEGNTGEGKPDIWRFRGSYLGLKKLDV